MNETLIKTPAAGKKAVKYPTKKTVNLAMRESRRGSVLTLVIGVCAIVTIAVCVAKFGVIDQYNRLGAVQSDYMAVHNQYTAMQDTLANYSAVQQEYRTYSRSWMTSGENSQFVTVDRTEVLDLIEDFLMANGTVNSISIQNDYLQVAMSGMNLEQISAMFAELQRQPIVMTATLNLASTEKETEDSNLDFSITIVLQPAAEEVGA